MAAKSTASPWAATPNEQKSGGWVAHDARLSGGVCVPPERPFAVVKYDAELALTFRMQTSMEVCLRFRIALAAREKKYPSEFLDRVLGQVGLTEKGHTLLVVANDVPPMESVLIA
jgi:hypothetical protein